MLYCFFWNSLVAILSSQLEQNKELDIKNYKNV